MEVFMKEKTTVAQKLQKFGAFLAGMVIPNIGAFIGFGLITAFFLSTGWTPNEELAKLISPILNNLLPILIAYTGGKMVGGQRGAVLGAFVTLGAIVAVEGTPMFLAAMILGPFSGLVISKFDKFIDGKVPGGFEMIVNNFSLGIIGAILCCFAYLVFGPLMHAVSAALTSGVNWMLDHNILPLSHIFVEPAKVLFLNNALDHGIFGPIGYDQVKQFGHSALFMLVPNPGPGLGLLLAYWFFGKGEMKEAAPGMIIIHFFGGIHEVYFPYVLSNPGPGLGVLLAY
jgi:PTS system mannitol-specific IIC component